MIRFEDLVEKVRANNPDADIELLRRAYVFSAFEHKGQVRHSGEPYLVHPLEVADHLADMKLDVVAIAAGLLHDIVEDTHTPLEPKAYESLRAHVESRRRTTEGMIEELKKNISAKLAEAEVPVIAIDGRIKRLFSIHQKLKRQKIDLDQVYDLVALRIVTDSV